MKALLFSLAIFFTINANAYEEVQWNKKWQDIKISNLSQFDMKPCDLNELFSSNKWERYQIGQDIYWYAEGVPWNNEEYEQIYFQMYKSADDEVRLQNNEIDRRELEGISYEELDIFTDNMTDASIFIEERAIDTGVELYIKNVSNAEIVNGVKNKNALTYLKAIMCSVKAK